MNRKPLLTLLLPAAALLSAPAAQAVETLSTAELAEHCQHYSSKPESADAIFCLRYIQGFVDGAIATDEKVAQNATADSGDETFVERALRTRTEFRRYPTYYADFCLGEEVPLRSVVQRVVHDLTNRKVASANQNARDAVYYTLRKSYPCRKS